MMEQGTESWKQQRAGYCTASRFSDVLAKPKTGKGESLSRKNYRIQLVTERLAGEAVEGFRNAAMAWGTEKEPEARSYFEAETGLMVGRTGFITHPDIVWCGCSPDGLISSDSGIEIKCPMNPTVHVETMLRDDIPPEHVAQVQGNMWVTGRDSWWFVSYDPRMPVHLRMYRKLVVRDETYIAVLSAEVLNFLAEVETTGFKLLFQAK